jgi:hypothetical protein
MTTSTLDPFRRAALAAAPAAAQVANYCDHAEHLEEVRREWITAAADKLQECAEQLAAEVGLDLLDLYAKRLGQIEARNVLGNEEAPDGSAAAASATSWRELQLVQVAHDRYYHPDVLGLSKAEQLRHYAFHLAKLVGAFATSEDSEELRDRRLPDALLFAIKLRTVAGERMSDEPLRGRKG